MEAQIQRILAAIRQSVSRQSGYGIGNLINLGNFLQLNLSAYDFSNLTIRLWDKDSGQCVQVLTGHQHWL